MRLACTVKKHHLLYAPRYNTSRATSTPITTLVLINLKVLVVLVLLELLVLIIVLVLLRRLLNIVGYSTSSVTQHRRLLNIVNLVHNRNKETN
jgi:hypothetical protein